ncbi:hypothetical protein B0T24DRAFT_514695, partial [Lasiosphaeria ovina]
MAGAASIPRFLLPQHGLIWRQAAAVAAGTTASAGPAPQYVRLASSSSSSSSSKKPSSSSAGAGPGNVLAKPERFNPPSHGARLPRKGGALPRHYGGELSSDEVQRQRAKDYPGLPPPPGTWGQWFWNSRGLHMAITLGTLTSLAVYTFTENFKRTSPFVDLLPTYSDMAAHPIASTRQVIEVVRMNAMHRAAETDRKRKRHVEDVEKRKLYRQAHGLPEEQGFFGLKQATIRTDAEMAAEAAA